MKRRPTRLVGARNGNWNPGPMHSSHGYVKVRVGRGHPLADSKGFAYGHLVTWAAAGRRLPRKHELLHHDNDDKTDNRLSNLVLITRKEHARLHARTAPRCANGTFARRAA